jgi:hypothetical protein
MSVTEQGDPWQEAARRWIGLRNHEKHVAIERLSEVTARLTGEGRPFDQELVAEACRRCFGSYPPSGVASEGLIEFLIERCTPLS